MDTLSTIMFLIEMITFGMCTSWMIDAKKNKDVANMIFFGIWVMVITICVMR